MFTFFTDRDGKMQLESLAQSGFDPLSRTCRFMLTEEAHHMFVGETGVGRAIERTCQAMKEAGIEDPNDIAAVRKLGVIDLPTMQKKANLHFSLSLDLFGSEVSTNAANYYNCRPQGPLPGDADRGRPPAASATYPVSKLVDGKVKMVDEPALTAINMRLRDDYVADCAKGVERWNKVIEKAGVNFRLELPHVAFHRHIGEFANVKASPDGEALERGGMGPAEGPVAALQGRRRLHREPDGALLGARQVRLLDRAAQGRHRQQGRRFRVREVDQA